MNPINGNTNGHHPESQASPPPDTVATYLTTLLQGKRPDGDPPGELCERAFACFDDDGAGKVREFLTLALRNPDHESYHKAIERALNNQPSARARSPFVRRSELGKRSDRQAVKWLVPDMIPSQGYVMWYGNESTGKSFLALRVANMVARQGKEVVYLAYEDGQSIDERQDAHDDFYDDYCPDDLVFMDADLPMFNDRDSMGRFLQALAHDNIKPGFIIVDTLSKGVDHATFDENSHGAIFAQAVQSVVQNLGCAVLVIHHSGKDAAKGARGHSALTANADVTALIEYKESDADDNDSAGQITITAGKNRLGQKHGKTYADLVHHDDSLVARLTKVNRSLKGNKAQVYAVLKQAGRPMTRGEIETAVQGKVKGTSVGKTLGRLVESGNVVKHGKLYRADCVEADLAETAQKAKATKQADPDAPFIAILKRHRGGISRGALVEELSCHADYADKTPKAIGTALDRWRQGAIKRGVIHEASEGRSKRIELLSSSPANSGQGGDHD